mgnify:FL=1
MTIRRTISDLPNGWPPDRNPRFAHLLAEKWRRENDQRRADHVPSGALFSASNAGKCSRYLSYRAVGIADSDPMDLTGHHNVTLGNIIHDAWQEAMAEAAPDYGFPAAEVSFEVEHRFLDGRGIAIVDAVLRFPEGGEYVEAPISDAHPSGDGGCPDKVIAYELKSTGGFGFKGAVGKVSRGKPAEGPRNEAVLQGAIGALCANADELIVGVIAKEAISASYGMAEIDRFTAEWKLTRDQYQPLAELEIDRVDAILGLVADGHLAARKIPGVAGEIVDPLSGRFEVRDANGTVVDVGTTWQCDYCSARTLCAATPSGRIPVETAVYLRAKLEVE